MSTKARRPVAAMSTMTPMKTPARTPRRKDRDVHAKQALLDNFDLEVQHRTADMRAQLDSALSAFLSLIDADLLKIPRAMRSMSLGELESCWAGSFAETSRAIAQRQFNENVPSTDEASVMAAAKRKRDESPSRTGKNAKSKPLPALPGKTRRTKAKQKPALPAATGDRPPQASEFNPHLPKTPKYPRQAKRNESFFSENGSPVIVGAEVEDEDDLPNPEEMEAAADRASAASRAAAPGSPSSRSSRLKRAPSLLFRQSILPLKQDNLAHIPLSDGRSISFNPLNLSPGRIDDELADGGLSEEEKRRVKKTVQDEVCRSLAERMERWKAM